MSTLSIATLFRRERREVIKTQWLACHRYTLYKLTPSKPGEHTLYFWENDDNVRVSRFYRSEEMALINFGVWEFKVESKVLVVEMSDHADSQN